MREVWMAVRFDLLNVFGRSGLEGMAAWWKEKSYGLEVKLHSSFLSSLTGCVTLLNLCEP